MLQRPWGCLGLFVWLSCLFTSACLDRPLCVDCKPQTTNQFVARIVTEGVDKIDLLFMVDASSSMADKQQYLTRAVPSLLARLLNPNCLDETGKLTGEPSSHGHCTRGTPEFTPVQDIHIGVISSSLGALGGTLCKKRFDNDQAWLLPLKRPDAALPSWNGSGFLAWDPRQTLSPPGSNDDQQLVTQFRNMISAVGEEGCGYEASLESWYRFLIDPDPPAQSLIRDRVTVVEGTDQTLLNQRAAFLRPDSLVAVIMLSDENDCSLRPGIPEWVPNGNLKLPRSTSACATDPNDPCCRSCYGESTTPAGCAPLDQDASCQISNGSYAGSEDHTNVRCWDQKRRFGFDMLEPVEKYIAGLSSDTVYDRAGTLRPNPLFTGPDGSKTRAKELVFVAGIVGVPWQDIASADSLSGSGLTYLTARELADQKRWPMLLGDQSGALPTDPHMIESVKPRTGAHPTLANAALAAPGTNNPRADQISGYERTLPEGDDLQYACIFELDQPKPCGTSGTCDCDATHMISSGPLCQPPSGGPATQTQYFAKAYPGVRELEVLRGIGDQAIVASICPKVVRSANPDSDPNYGYNPAIAALLKQLVSRLSGRCLPRPPSLQPNGETACAVLEARLDGKCDCHSASRVETSPDALLRIRENLERDGLCKGKACESVCACGIPEARGEALKHCRSTAPAEDQNPSFCYVEPDAGLGDPALVRDCPANQRRLLRFVGQNTPAKGSLTYMACFGATSNGK